MNSPNHDWSHRHHDVPRHLSSFYQFKRLSTTISLSQYIFYLGAILVRTIDLAHEETLSFTPSHQVINSRSSQDRIRSKGQSQVLHFITFIENHHSHNSSFLRFVKGICNQVELGVASRHQFHVPKLIKLP